MRRRTLESDTIWAPLEFSFELFLLRFKGRTLLQRMRVALRGRVVCVSCLFLFDDDEWESGVR